MGEIKQSDMDCVDNCGYQVCAMHARTGCSIFTVFLRLGVKALVHC